uniref:Glycosyltransferase n=1 Tax=Linum usitatissimum TaxID=4006 RepID=I2BH16_LINUS|nr:UDP-glycosyltransferase 1 [Linum usitatissimum]
MAHTDSNLGTLKHTTKRAELVFIPSPGVGHITALAQLAQLLVARDDNLWITILIMHLPHGDANYTNHTTALASTSSALSDRVKFVDLPPNDAAVDPAAKDVVSFFMYSYKSHIRDAVSKLVDQSPFLSGFLVDMFCTTFIDVAVEFGLPSYVFYTSGAGCLNLTLYFQNLRDAQNVPVSDFNNPVADWKIEGFANSIPGKVLPRPVLNPYQCDGFLNFVQNYRNAKGIVINTFPELESATIEHLSKGGNPPVYPVGPILELKRGGGDVKDKGRSSDIMNWLNEQPPSSVVFLCFGSNGCFNEKQVKQIAEALERAGYRFLWSLRRPPPKGTVSFPLDYENPSDVLPEGFLERTTGLGKIIGWAPQAAILAHSAVGGFVSHCGWNSILESLWFGVPIATWPIDGEQQLNAFEMVKEWGLGVDIKMEYSKEFGVDEDDVITVSSDEIEKGLKGLMEDQGGEVRERVRKLSDKCREALAEGGSADIALNGFITDAIRS